MFYEKTNIIFNLTNVKSLHSVNNLVQTSVDFISNIFIKSKTQ